MLNNKNNNTTSPASAPNQQPDMPLSRNNWIVMIIAGVLIVLGFVLMTGSASGVDAYNPDIFSTRRIVIGPMLSFLGFLVMGIAIIIKPKK